MYYDPQMEEKIAAVAPINKGGRSSDARIQQIMEDLGTPNSMSLYQAFQQFEMEIKLALGVQSR